MRDQTADILWALTSPDVYRLLVVQSHWSGAAHEKWLTQTLRSQPLA